eukprot:m.122899 g.122899  ORF g.122899 m.122899 type:complete len:73 (+) comp14435_c0_seq9:2996-3214(+)
MLKEICDFYDRLKKSSLLEGRDNNMGLLCGFMCGCLGIVFDWLKRSHIAGNLDANGVERIASFRYPSPQTTC